MKFKLGAPKIGSHLKKFVSLKETKDRSLIGCCVIHSTMKKLTVNKNNLQSQTNILCVIIVEILEFIHKGWNITNKLKENITYNE